MTEWPIVAIEIRTPRKMGKRNIIILEIKTKKQNKLIQNVDGSN